MSDLIVITGAAGGIGSALVERWLAGGSARVAALDIDPDALARLARSAPGGRLFTYEADVSDGEALERAGRKIRAELGAPAIWINNAGCVKLGPFDEVSPGDFARVVDVCFNGAVNGTRVALSLMSRPERGSIVNIASAAGIAPSPFMSSYVAAKSALVAFTRSLRLELRHRHSPIRMVLACPGWVDTPIMEDGGGIRFPRWLRWLVSESVQAAREIQEGIEAGRDEIFPTASAKLIRGMQSWAPGSVAAATRLILARDWKQALGLDPILPRRQGMQGP